MVRFFTITPCLGLIENILYVYLKKKLCHKIKFDLCDLCIFVATFPVCNSILRNAKTTEPDMFLQFLLDCSSLPDVIKAANQHGPIIFKILFKATRTFCYTLYRKKRRMLDQWIWWKTEPETLIIHLFKIYHRMLRWNKD